jgi:hypothetical protein
LNANIDSELLGLFGRWTLATAQVKRLDDLNVDPDIIRKSTQLIIEERGHPDRQRAFVDALDEDTAVAVCIWLRDPANASSLLKHARAKARKRS